MCGIAGYFGTRTMAPGIVERMLRGAAPARTRCGAHGVLSAGLRAHRRRRAQRAGAHAAVDHRPAPGSRPADGQRRRRRVDRLQRRGLRLGGRRGDAARGGLPFPHVVRHRIHPARLRALGHRLLHAAARHVRVRDRRLRSAARARRARPARAEADGLRARDDGFAFASTVRALLPWLPRAARAFSAEAIDAYLAHRTIPAPRTIFDDMSRLPPAHHLHYDLASGNACDARILAARALRRAVARRRSTKRSGCAPWPTARSDSSCRAASIRAPSRAGSPRRASIACNRSRRRFPARRSTKARKRASPPGDSAFPISRSTSRRHRRRFSAHRRRARRAVRRSVVRFRRGISRARRRAT